MPHPLDGCRAKIKWAYEKIDDLKARMKAFGEANPHGIFGEYDSERGRLLIKFARVKKIPDEFRIIIGEILYQQRSALDHMVFQLVPAPTDSTALPIYSTEARYKSGKDRKIQGISASAERRIELLQPFHRGAAFEEDPLWMIQELNNIDKHRLLIVTKALVGVSPGEIKLDFEPPGIVSKSGRGDDVKFVIPMAVEDGAVLAWAETVTRKVNVNGQVPVAVVFEQIGSTKLKSIFPLLTQLTDYVSGILDSFEGEFT